MDVMGRAREAAKAVIDANRRYALGHPSRKAIYVDAADEAYDIVEAVAPILTQGAVEALREYGRHKATCARLGASDKRPCDCGLADALQHHGGGKR